MTHTYMDLILLSSSQQILYDIYLLLCVQYQTPDDGRKTYPKHVEFYSKNKCEKLLHFVGFIYKIINVKYLFCHAHIS